MNYATQMTFEIAAALYEENRGLVTVTDVLEVAATVTQKTLLIDIRDQLLDRAAARRADSQANFRNGYEQGRAAN